MTESQTDVDIATASLADQRTPVALRSEVDLSYTDYLGATRRGPVAWVSRERQATRHDISTGLAELAGTAEAVVTASCRGVDAALLTGLTQRGYLTAVAQSNVGVQLREACTAAGVQLAVVAAGDATALDGELMRHAYGHSVVVVNAVSALDGRLADLAPLHEVAVRHGALLLVRESHSLGVIGEEGRGLVHASGLAGRSDVLVTARLDGLGSSGTVVLGDSALLATIARMLPPEGQTQAWVEQTQAALEWLRDDPSLPRRVLARARELAFLAHGARWLAGAPQGPLLPLVLSSALRRDAALVVLYDHGVTCAPAPEVLGTDCLHRIVLAARADLTDDDLDVVSVALTRAHAELS